MTVTGGQGSVEGVYIRSFVRAEGYVDFVREQPWSPRGYRTPQLNRPR